MSSPDYYKVYFLNFMGVITLTVFILSFSL